MLREFDDVTVLSCIGSGSESDVADAREFSEHLLNTPGRVTEREHLRFDQCRVGIEEAVVIGVTQQPTGQPMRCL